MASTIGACRLGRSSSLALSAGVFLVPIALLGCARRVPGAAFQDKGILIERRYAAPQSRVFTEAARALTDLGYVIASRDSGESSGVLRSAPRLSWDTCVSPDVQAASQHPGVLLFVVTDTERDSAVFRVGASTLTRVPDAVVNGKRMNPDLIVKMCALLSVAARVDTLLGMPPSERPPDVVRPRDSVESATEEYDRLVAPLRT